MKRIIPFLFVLVLVSCKTTEGYRQSMNRHLGKDINHVMRVWGVPDEERVRPDGSMVIAYHDERNFTMPGITTYQPQTTYHSGAIMGAGMANYSGTSTSYVPTTSAPTNIHQFCSTYFEADKNGIITNVSFKGNMCKSDGPSGVQMSVSEPKEIVSPVNGKCPTSGKDDLIIVDCKIGRESLITSPQECKKRGGTVEECL